MENSVLAVVAEMMKTPETNTEKMEKLEKKLRKVGDRYIKEYEKTYGKNY